MLLLLEKPQDTFFFSWWRKCWTCFLDITFFQLGEMQDVSSNSNTFLEKVLDEYSPSCGVQTSPSCWRTSLSLDFPPTEEKSKQWTFLLPAYGQNAGQLVLLHFFHAGESGEYIFALLLEKNVRHRFVLLLERMLDISLSS